MPDVMPRRLRLWGEPSQLAGVDENTLEETRRYLRRLRDDVELMYIDQRAADSIDIILLLPDTLPPGDISEIATVLREILGIGAGPHALIGEDPGQVRGIGGEGRTCPRCHGSDGSHVPGCPNESR